MPGPIETAFVEVVATLEPGDLESQLTAAVARAVAKAEPVLGRLEKAGVEAANGIRQAMDGINLNLDVRRAIQELGTVDAGAQRLVSQLGNITVILTDEEARGTLRQLDAQAENLRVDIQSIGEGGVNVDFASAERTLREMLVLADELTTEIRRIGDERPNFDTSAAIKNVQALGNEINQALRDVEDLDGQKLDVNVDDAQIRSLVSRLDEAQAAVRRLADENPKVKVDIDTDQITRKAAEVGARAGSSAGDQFGRVFKRSLEFGFVALITRDLFQVVRQLFSAGLQAAGAIQTTQVSINRFFAQSKDLGESAVGFFTDLRTLALQTPFQFANLADDSRKILAMGLNAKQTTGFLSDLADAVSQVGGTQSDLDGVVRAISQLSSKGKVDLQDFRQISEHLPSLSRQMQIQGVIDELNKLHPGLNATIADFDEMRKSGLITGQVLRDGLIGALKEIPGAEGAARASAATLQGALSNLKDFATVEFSQAFQGLGVQLSNELNTAFSSLTGAQLSPLAQAVAKVIDTFGRAGEEVFPKITAAIEELGPPISNIVTELGTLGEAVIPLLTQAVEGGIGAFTGLLTIVQGLTQVIDLLPDSFQKTAAGALLLAKVIPGAGERMVAPFTAVRQALTGVREGEAAVALGASLMEAALTGGLLIGLQLVLTEMAKGAEDTRKFADGVDTAKKSVEEFDTALAASANFIKQFSINKISVPLDPDITSGDLAKRLGVSTTQLAHVVESVSRLGPDFNKLDLKGALDGTGLSMDRLTASGGTAAAALGALVEQFRLGQAAALSTAISSKEFALVSDDVANKIAEAANKSGDYTKGLEDLKAANEAAAKAALGTVGATQDQIDAALKANTTVDEAGRVTVDYAAALQDLRTEIMTTNDAFQALADTLPGFSGAFAGLTDGTGDLSLKLVQFADNSKEAGLQADDLNAVANKLKDSLGRVLTGDELSKVFGALTAAVDSAKAALDGMIPSVADLEQQTGKFSLSKFISELGKIALSRAQVEGNVEKLLTTFGGLGAKALTALSNSGLSKDQFALALQQALAGGEGTIKQIVDNYAFATAGDLQGAAEQMAAAGFSPDDIDKILGVQAFQDGVTKVGAAVDGLDLVSKHLQSINNDIALNLARFDPNSIADEVNIRKLQAAKGNAVGQAAPAAGAIDTSAATAQAAGAGDAVGAAFNDHVQTALAAGGDATSKAASAAVAGLGVATAGLAAQAGLAASNAFGVGFGVLPFQAAVTLGQVEAQVTQATAVLGLEAAVMGETVTQAFADGLNLVGVVVLQLVAAGGTLLSGLGLDSFARSLGFRVGAAMDSGLASGIQAHSGEVSAALSGVIQAAVAKAKGDLGIKSPSKVFEEIGGQVARGFAIGVGSLGAPSLPAPRAVPAAAGRGSGGAPTAEDVAAAVGRALAGSGRPGSTHNNTFNLTGPTNDPDAMAARIAARLERRI